MGGRALDLSAIFCRHQHRRGRKQRREDQTDGKQHTPLPPGNTAPQGVGKTGHLAGPCQCPVGHPRPGTKVPGSISLPIRGCDPWLPASWGTAMQTSFGRHQRPLSFPTESLQSHQPQRCPIPTRLVLPQLWGTGLCQPDPGMRHHSGCPREPGPPARQHSPSAPLHSAEWPLRAEFSGGPAEDTPAAESGREGQSLRCTPPPGPRATPPGPPSSHETALPATPSPDTRPLPSHHTATRRSGQASPGA